MSNALQSSNITVLVVDDHGIARRGIISILDAIPDIRILGEAASGEEAIALARALKPDIVLMDLRMPGIGGLEAARRIGIALPDTRTIAVTAWDAEPPQRLGRNGIAACVGKDVKPPELEAVIRRVLCQRRNPQPACAIEPARNPFDLLTGREMQVCTLLLAGQRARQIASSLFIAPKTVHTFRYRLFEKLGISGDVELTKLATAHGLLGARGAEFVAEPDPPGAPPDEGPL